MAIDPTNKIFTWTPMIRMSDMRYPVYLADFLREHTNVSIGDFVWEYEMAELWKYFKVYDSEVPKGDVVTEGQPVYNEKEERWYKTWESRDFTPEEIEQNLIRSKEEHRYLAYQIFGAQMQSGAKVGDDTFVIDPAEISSLRLIKSFAEENPTSTVLLRTADFNILELTSEEAQSKIDQILSTAGAAHQRLLAYVKSVNDTKLIADVPQTPLTFLGE